MLARNGRFRNGIASSCAFVVLFLLLFVELRTEIVVQNSYYPKAGLEDRVLQQRRKASALLRDLELPVGRILKQYVSHTNEIGQNSQAYVMWECNYPNATVREHVLQVLNASVAWAKVEDEMETLLANFDRQLWEAV